jgi:DNA-directed RNA polymerase specialized sigma24 family protein
VAIRVAQDIFRRERQRTVRERDRELLAGRTDDEWEGHTWMLAVRGLPEPECSVMWRRFVLAYERQAIADELGMSLRSVDYHISRALGRLRHSFDLGTED